MDFYKKSRLVTIIGAIGSYLVIYGLYALMNYLIGDPIGVIFVALCLVIVFSSVKRIIKAKSVLGYILTFIISAFVGQFVAPLVLGFAITRRVNYALFLSEVEESSREQLLKWKSAIKSYIDEYEDIKDTEKDAKFKKVKPNIFGFKDYFDALNINDKIGSGLINKL